MDHTVHEILQVGILKWVAIPFSKAPSQPRSPTLEPRSPALQVDSLPAEPPGKPKNTGVGRLSLLQQIFLTQESDRGFWHWWWILYQLSYKGTKPDPPPVFLHIVLLLHPLCVKSLQSYLTLQTYRL